MTGAVSVLLVSVSVVALPTSVSVATGNVRTPDPAAAGAARVIVPLVSPAIITELMLFPLKDNPPTASRKRDCRAAGNRDWAG